MLGVSVVCCLWLFGEELAGPGGGLCCVAKAFYQQEDSQMLKNRSYRSQTLGDGPFCLSPVGIPKPIHHYYYD